MKFHNRKIRQIEGKESKQDTLFDKNRFLKVQMIVLGENTSSCSHYFSLLFFFLTFLDPFPVGVILFLSFPSPPF